VCDRNGPDQICQYIKVNSLAGLCYICANKLGGQQGYSRSDRLDDRIHLVPPDREEHLIVH